MRYAYKPIFAVRLFAISAALGISLPPAVLARADELVE